MTTRTPKQIEAGNAAQKKYNASLKGRVALKTAQRKYEASLEGKARRRKYDGSPKGKAANQRYRLSPKGKAYLKAYHKAQYEERKALAREYLGGLCVRCGTSEGLEFDHIEPKDKAYEISSAIRRMWETIVKELDKCQLLCHGCHATKTKEDRSHR